MQQINQSIIESAMKIKSMVIGMGICTCLISGTHAAEKINHDTVTPIFTGASDTQIKFNPKISIQRGCQFYAAVDEDGNWSGGLKPEGFAYNKNQGCSSTNNPQVYARETKITSDIRAIMYAYFFPKDQGNYEVYDGPAGHRYDWEYVLVFVENDITVIGSAYSFHGTIRVKSNPGFPVEGKYAYNTGGIGDDFTHSMDYTDDANYYGENIVGWDNLPAAAKDRLSTQDWGSAVMPMKDSKFNENITKAAEKLGYL